MESSARTGRNHAFALDSPGSTPINMTTANSAKGSRHFCTSTRSSDHSGRGRGTYAPNTNTATTKTANA